jgi:hypothetical protein
LVRWPNVYLEYRQSTGNRDERNRVANSSNIPHHSIRKLMLRKFLKADRHIAHHNARSYRAIRHRNLNNMELRNIGSGSLERHLSGSSQSGQIHRATNPQCDENQSKDTACV